ncbi:MAG: polyphosphate kinase 1 [Rikenellaceae bacterium]
MEQYYNRELSWLQFNDRVLQEAMDKSVPLLQRLRFLGIFSNNQDEFIKVRIANIIRYASMPLKTQPELTGNVTAAHLLSLLNDRVSSSQVVFRNTYEEILDELESHGVYMVNNNELNEKQLEFCREYFLSVVSVRLTSILLRKRVPAPFLPDGKAYLAIRMQSAKSSRHAILQIPVSKACPRFVVLPSTVGRTDIIFLDDILRLFLDDIFFMFSYHSITAYTFKIVRDAQMTLDDDTSKSITQKMEVGIDQREKGSPVRLVFDRTMPTETLSIIARKLGFKTTDQLEPGSRYHMMRDLMKFPRVRPELENKNPKPMLHPSINPWKSVLKAIKKEDILLCYPYHTFKHFLDLLREAAVDPLVTAIYITLYRTADHSKVINALLNAVKNGKQVTAMVELKARFDEEQNIDNTELLQKGGVKVIHSVDMMKVHSKLVLIERTEGSNPKRGYVYVGTGNFNEDTATIYSDFGLLTANEDIASDARKVFDFLLNTHKRYDYKRLLVAPYGMRDQISEIIETEIKNAKKGKEAYFCGKFNSLTDLKMIKLLYKASNAGVKIRLIVRGACCLEAGVKGMSENIEVHSIVDKFLEHARLIIVANGGQEKSYIFSADLMTRNLNRRVEVGVDITSPTIHSTLVDYFNIQWQDNVKARLIAAPYLNNYVDSRGEQPHQSQEELYDYFTKI